MAISEEVIGARLEAADPQILEQFAESPLRYLTARQIQIVDLASQGLSLDETAEALGITYATAKSRRSEATLATQAFSAAHVVRMACDAELFSEPLEKPLCLREPSLKLLAVIDLASKGFSERYIGRELGISPRAARGRRERGMHALGANTFPHAVRLAMECSFIPLTA